MANEIKMVLGSAQTVISHAGNLANGTYVYSGLTGFTGTEFDNSTLLYPFAKAVLTSVSGPGTAITAVAAVSLWMMRNDIDSTADMAAVPDSTNMKNAQFVGTFPIISAINTAFSVEIPIQLAGVKKALFYIKNETGVTLNASAGNELVVKITPYTFGPA